MSKLTEQLRTIEVFNASDFAGKGNPYIVYYPNDYSRGGDGSHFAVVRLGFQTDPNAHWGNYGCKTFIVWNKNHKPKAFEEAKAWAGARYKITEWARTPFGTWMDARVVKGRLDTLKLLMK